MKVSKFHASAIKRFVDLILSSIIIVISSPLIIIISVLIALASSGGVFFLQERTGKNGLPFKIIKFRTMVKNAEKLKSKFKKLNESDGPAFKISNDPRFTPFGKIISKTGLDELPQFFNVLKGEMSIVGPRPLPVNESKKLNVKDKIRELVKPGITSTWVTQGQHNLSFKKWMELDKKYVENASLKEDTIIIVNTFFLIIKFMGREFKSL